jgi:DNA-binding NarL/FixJ family response regulator
MLRVLLADDSDLILTRLQQMVGHNHLAEIAGVFRDGRMALEGLRTLKPDLAILDIKMPGLSGLEVLHEIRKENPVIKVIMLTFYSSENYRNLALRYGADYFFSKVDDFEKISPLLDELSKTPES